jgi:hypothetical protein
VPVGKRDLEDGRLAYVGRMVCHSDLLAGRSSSRSSQWVLDQRRLPVRRFILAVECLVYTAGNLDVVNYCHSSPIEPKAGAAGNFGCAVSVAK